MGTIQIHSNKTDDLYFLNELARRMNLKTEIKIPKTETSVGRMQPAIDYEDTAQRIFEKIKMGLKEVEEMKTGKRELKSLDELLDEY